MGKIDVTDSPRRSSGRIRKPTYKLRGENGLNVNDSSLTEPSNTDFRVPNSVCTNRKLYTRNKVYPEVSKAPSYSKNSNSITKSPNREPDLDLREEHCDTYSDENNLRNGRRITPLSRKRSRTKNSVKTQKCKYKKSMKLEDTLSSELLFGSINANKVLNLEGKVTGTLNTAEAAGHHATVETETKIEMEVVENGSLEARTSSPEEANTSSPEEAKTSSPEEANTSSFKTHDYKDNSNTMTGENNCKDIADEILVKVKTESGIAHTDKYNKCSNTNPEGTEVDLKPFKATYVDGSFHQLKTDGSINEIEGMEDTGDTDVICTICSKHYTNRNNLNKHMLLHADKKPFQCEVCGLSFALKNYLTTHKLVHTGVRSHKCDICGKQFLRRTNLNSHMKTHSDSKAYPCDICDKRFKTKFGLDCHHTAQHVGGFVCHTCGKSYSHQNYLRKHLSIHAGEKPFECTECGKCFSYNQSLQEHMRRHLGEKPEVCDQCGKRFNNKRELKNHSKYHQNTAGYACTECNVRYNSLQSLNKHMSKTHKQTHNCVHCNECFVNKKHLRSHVFQQHRDLNTHKLSDMDLAKVKKVECSLCQKVFFNRYVLSKHLVSMHQLTEESVKTMLQIRKKAASKPVSGRILDGDIDKDLANSLENDKTFQVYYKDDEMAVYVKRVDDFNEKHKHESRLNEKQISGNLDDLDARYIVVEEDNAIVNELAEIGLCVGDDKITENVNNSACIGMPMSTSDTNPELVSTECVTSEPGIEDSYVVIADHNEHSTEELANQVVGEGEMFEISNNGSERIVLILNEGSGDGIIFDGSEQFEIVEGGMEFAEVDHGTEMSGIVDGSQRAANSYEIVANTPLISNEYAEVIMSEVGNSDVPVTSVDCISDGNVTVTDGNINSDGRVTVTDGNIISDGRVTVTDGNIISDGRVNVTDRNIISDERVTVTDGNIISNGRVTVTDGNIISNGRVTVSSGNIISDGSVTVSDGNIISDRRVTVSDGNIISDGRVTVSSGNIISDGRVNVSDGNINSNGRVNVTNGSILKEISGVHVEEHIQYSEAGSLSNVDQGSSHGYSEVEHVAMETCDTYLGIMPKNSSVEEFSKFENALKTKVVDFQDNSEYVAFLDKMIQSIQNAKHTPPFQ